jgi:hypothetical protein
VPIRPLDDRCGNRLGLILRRKAAGRSAALEPEDRRRNIITITPAGARQFRRLDRVLAGVQDELLAPLSADERDELARLLREVLDHHARG